MILLKKDFKHGLISAKISFDDDLWYLTQIIEEGDVVSSKTERKIKIGDASTGNAKVVRKVVYLSVTVESVSLSDSGDMLRVKGVVAEGTEDVPSGSYHTLNLAVNSVFKLWKSSWSSYLKKRLDEAVNNTAENVLFVLFDREKTLFSILRQSGIEHLSESKNDSSGKQYASSSSEDLFKSIVSSTLSFVSSHNISSVVVGCPDFWKEYLQRAFSDCGLSMKPVFITLTTIDRSMVSKLLSRPELHALLRSQRLSRERKFLDTFLEKLDKQMVVYGVDDVEQAAAIGAISDVGVTDVFIRECKHAGTYDRLDNILSTVDSSQGSIHLIKGEETSRTINGLGGIAGIVRWQLE